MFSMDMSNEIKRHRLSGQEFLGFVADNNDPLRQQRVKVRIRELHRNIPIEDLPWVTRKNPASTGNNSNGTGNVTVPSIGSRVVVTFMGEDPYNCFYSGAADTADLKLDEELLMGDYPNVYGHVDRSGNIFATNTEKDLIDIIHVSGTHIQIDASGNLNIIVAGNLDISVNGNTEIKSSGTTNISSGGRIDISGSQVHLNTSSAISPKSASPRQRPEENYVDDTNQ